MIQNTYIKKLEDAQIINEKGYGKGIPIWYKNGIDLVNNIFQVFKECLQSEINDFYILDFGNIIHKSVYDQVYGDINNYDSIYTFKDNNSDYLIKSDAMPLNISYLLETTEKRPVLTLTSVARNETGSTKALFRDRNIWPVIQLNHVIKENEINGFFDKLTQVYRDFFRKLCLPTLFVDAGELHNYASSQRYFVTALDNLNFTKSGMIFQLSENFKENFNTNFELIDSGFSEKVIALMAILHSDQNGLILPTSVAPSQVIIASALDNNMLLIEQVEKLLNSQSIRCSVKREENNIKKIKRQWEKEGAPLLIILDEHEITLYMRTSRKKTVLTIEDLNDLSPFLLTHDKALYSKANKFLELIEHGHSTEDRITFICKDCKSGNNQFFGHIYPYKYGECDVCKINKGVKSILSTRGRFY